MSIRENRNADDLAELRSRMFLEDTQPASEVLSRRIREYRKAKNLSQKALADAVTNVGLALTGDKVSKIEKGVRRVGVDELLAFAGPGRATGPSD